MRNPLIRHWAVMVRLPGMRWRTMYYCWTEKGAIKSAEADRDYWSEREPYLAASEWMVVRR